MKQRRGTASRPGLPMLCGALTSFSKTALEKSVSEKIINEHPHGQSLPENTVWKKEANSSLFHIPP